MSYGRVVKLLIVHYMYCYFFEKSLMRIEGILLKYNDKNKYDEYDLHDCV